MIATPLSCLAGRSPLTPYRAGPLPAFRTRGVSGCLSNRFGGIVCNANTWKVARMDHVISLRNEHRSSDVVTSLRDGVGSNHKLAVDEIADNPRNPQGRVQHIDDLIPSISRVGVLVPILVTPVEDWLQKHPEDAQAVEGKRWVAQDGMRRLAAARHTGRLEVPYQVRGVDIDESLIRLHTAKALRLTPIEEAQQYRMLIDSESLTQQQIAVETGVSQGHVAKRLKLLTLPTSIQDAVDSGRVGVDEALRLAAAKDDDLAERVGLALVESLRTRPSNAAVGADTADEEDATNGAGAQGTDLDALVRRVTQERAAESGRQAAQLRAEELHGEYCDDVHSRLGAARFTHQIYKPSQIKAAAADKNLLVVPTRTEKPDYYLIHAARSETTDRRQRLAAETTRGHALREAAVTKVPSSTVQEALVTLTLSGLSMLAKGGSDLAYELARAADLTPDGLGDWTWRQSLSAVPENQRQRVAWVIALAVLEKHVRDAQAAWGSVHVRYFALLRSVVGYVPTEWEQAQLDAAASSGPRED